MNNVTKLFFWSAALTAMLLSPAIALAQNDADTQVELGNANITANGAGLLNPSTLQPSAGTLQSNLRAFADAMDGKAYNASNPVLNGVTCRWGRPKAATLGINEIAIATHDPGTPAVVAVSGTAWSSAYASGSTDVGEDATAQSTGPISDAFAVGGHNTGAGGRGGDATADATNNATAYAGNAAAGGGRGGHATATGGARAAALAVAGDGGNNGGGAGGLGGTAIAFCPGGTAQAFAGRGGDSTVAAGANGGNGGVATATGGLFAEAVGGRGGDSTAGTAGDGGLATANAAAGVALADGGDGGDAAAGDGGDGGDAFATGAIGGTSTGGDGGTGTGAGNQGGDGGDAGGAINTVKTPGGLALALAALQLAIRA